MKNQIKKIQDSIKELDKFLIEKLSFDKEDWKLLDEVSKDLNNLVFSGKLYLLNRGEFEVVEESEVKHE